MLAKIKGVQWYALVAVLLFIVVVFKRKTEKMTGDLLDSLVKFLLAAEGGLTNNLADSASKNPSPTPERYHTNKGVTWTVFRNNGNLGYDPSVENFLLMPFEIWYLIWKHLYYDKTTITTDPIMKAYLSTWSWGGWDRRLVTEKEVNDVLSSSMIERNKLLTLSKLRKVYFEKVVLNNPKDKVFLAGWLKRQDMLVDLMLKFIN